ncbi:MAG: dihydrodipicolinate synthase family protein [Acetobacteraceae bacterium]|nr:dihydrodipicolinate synthase family protein [Acetobacteraceae bacterium]MDW8398742.1 dihydrodipicolinate synthase family protein [Acetobacteraceae bacterium]
MDRNDVDWHGVIPALVTPFTAEGAIDVAALRRNIELMLEAGCHGVLIGGCTAEFWALSPQERVDIIRIAADTLRGRGTLIAGTGAIRTEEAIALTAAAKEAGADGALVLPPYFVQPSEDDIVAHFRAISDAVAIPIMLYNIPHCAANAITPALAARLAEVPNVVAIKESSGNWGNFQRTLLALQDRLRVFCGPSSVFGVAATVMGAVGHIDCFPNVYAAPMVRMWQDAEAGRMEAARATQELCVKLTDLFVAEGRNLYCATKAAMNMLGLPGGHPRLPLRPLPPESEASLRRGMAALGFPV